MTLYAAQLTMTFNYIIVGAGSASCVLANRLSADPATSVLLLEAGGPDKKMEIHIPAAYAKLHGSAVDWGFWAEPQKALDGRRMYQPRGKTLGGCSSTNAMAYVGGNHLDYDDWAALGQVDMQFHFVPAHFGTTIKLIFTVLIRIRIPMAIRFYPRYLNRKAGSTLAYGLLIRSMRR